MAGINVGQELRNVFSTSDQYIQLKPGCFLFTSLMQFLIYRVADPGGVDPDLELEKTGSGRREKTRPRSDPRKKPCIRPNTDFFFWYKSQYNCYIIGIDQDMVMDPIEVDPDPDPTGSRSTSLHTSAFVTYGSICMMYREKQYKFLNVANNPTDLSKPSPVPDYKN